MAIEEHGFLFLLNPFCVDFDVYLESLSCWTIVAHHVHLFMATVYQIC